MVMGAALVIINMYLVYLVYAQEWLMPKAIFKTNDAFSLNNLYCYAPAQEPGVIITVLVDVSLVIITIYTQFDNICPDVKKRMYIKNTLISHFSLPNNLFSLVGEVMKFTISCLLNL